MGSLNCSALGRSGAAVLGVLRSGAVRYRGDLVIRKFKPIFGRALPDLEQGGKFEIQTHFGPEPYHVAIRKFEPILGILLVYADTSPA
jgi:hypothetical protein